MTSYLQKRQFVSELAPHGAESAPTTRRLKPCRLLAGAFVATVCAQRARRTVIGIEVIAKLAGHAEARRFDTATCL
jgi:hypothetical protein